MKKIFLTLIFVTGTVLAQDKMTEDCRNYASTCWKNEKCLVLFPADELGKREVMGSPFMYIINEDQELELIPITISKKKFLQRKYIGHNSFRQSELSYNRKGDITSVKVYPLGRPDQAIECGPLTKINP